jgi:precorrin-6A synthase
MTGTVRRLLVLGVGMGPQHVTGEVAAALRSCDYVIAVRKGEDDALLAVRRSIAEKYGVPVVEVPDPERDRPGRDRNGSPFHYAGAVTDWHAARVDAFAPVLAQRGGTAGFLVWGDPSLYDSTVRIVSALAARLGAPFEVLPGISAPQLLAARHKIVLHEVGCPLHITTARRLAEAVEGGQDNILVVLSRSLDLESLGDWSVWWGANLGTPSEELVSGRVADVRASLSQARDRAKSAAGWVLDICLLRRPVPDRESAVVDRESARG